MTNLSLGGTNPADSQFDLLIPLRDGDHDRPPLFCVHPVSGSAYPYSKLAGLLRAGQAVYGFEAPGFDNDRVPVSLLPQLADEYTAILRAFAPGQTYQLLGWSLGGFLAFEIAKRLSAVGQEVATLILVDSPLPRTQPLPPERESLLRFLNDMLGISEEEAPPRVQALASSWPDNVDAAKVFPLIEEAAVLPGEMDVELLMDQYAVFQALLRGFHSIDVTGCYSGDALHILAEISPQDEMNWRRALPQVREVTLPGTHYTIWSGQSLVQMSEIVQTALDSHQRG